MNILYTGEAVWCIKFRWGLINSRIYSAGCWDCAHAVAAAQGGGACLGGTLTWSSYGGSSTWGLKKTKRGNTKGIYVNNSAVI